MVKGIRHTCIVAGSLERSLKFYRDILGLRVTKILTVRGKYPEVAFDMKGAKITYVKMRSPGQPKGRPPVFELHYWRNPRRLPKPGYGHISFSVGDIDYEYRRLCKLRVKFISPPVTAPDRKTKICFAYDPDGYLIEFVEDLKNA